LEYIYAGVETVKADLPSNKVTVTGKFDTVKLQEKLVEKTKKKVELLTPPPKKDAAAAAEKPAEKKSDEKKPEEKKAEEKKPEEKKPKEVFNFEITIYLILNFIFHMLNFTNRLCIN
jgi:ribosomal protein L12E/L44/L45/RPP1/RPP2